MFFLNFTITTKNITKKYFFQKNVFRKNLKSDIKFKSDTWARLAQTLVWPMSAAAHLAASYSLSLTVLFFIGSQLICESGDELIFSILEGSSAVHANYAT